MLIVAMVTPLLSGCFGKGSSADPPSNFLATAGDGRVMITWDPNPGVDYWLFTSTSPSLTAFNWAGLPNAHVYLSASTPFYMCGLLNGTYSSSSGVSPQPYYFAANGRINGGPGGSSSPTRSATPYNASAGTWTPIYTTPATDLYGVGYTSLTTCSNNSASATGTFAAVGQGGAIFTSADGKTWTPATPPPGFTTDLYAVTGYAANQNNPGSPAMRWVAVGAGGASVYSLDGNIWADGSAYNALSPALRSLTRVAGTFFAVGDAGTILSSTDGITWTSHISGTPNNLNGVTHGSIFVAVGDSGTILTSVDGNTWTTQTSVTLLTTSHLRQVTSYGSIIVAVGDSGTILTSIDSGANWVLATLPGSPDLVGIVAETQFIANATIDPLLGFISTALFVAVDSSGNFYTSLSGRTWSSANSTNISSPKALVSTGYGYVAAGLAGATAYAF
jgi:hypothetical protein